LTASSLAALDEHASRTASFATGDGVIIAGARDLGEPGLDLYVPAPHAAFLADRLRMAGAAVGDLGTWETLRVEAGRPAFGLDMNAETIPLEAGIEGRAISFTKGCYVGQEVIIRVVHRGQGRVAKHLVGLAYVAPAEGHPGPRQPLSPGDVVMDRNGERRIGQITSAVFSPRLQTTIALGYVSRDFVDPGTRVVASSAAGTCLMEVRPLPFVREP
jgi:folate-binding protein YgfZ